MSLEKDGGTISARKAVMGHCPNPDCGLVLVVVPDAGGLWPPFVCPPTQVRRHKASHLGVVDD